MRLAEYRSLLAHMEWADAATWKTATGLAGARQDAQIPDRLYHLHSVHFGSAAPATLAETILQVAMHTAYHRGQIATRLRELGGEPQITDFIMWIWMRRPEADWPSA